MITNELTIFKTNVELNTMLEAQEINDDIKNYWAFLVKYGIENINFIACVKGWSFLAFFSCFPWKT